MSGIQQTPLRIPDAWSASWFRTFVTEVIAKADIRNAIGQGVTITSDGNSVATISADAETAGAVTSHNVDPLAHADAFAAHRAESDPHPQYNPGGSDTQVQFNDGGAFGASDAVTFLSPDTSWGGTVLKVYEDNGNSAVLSAVSDTGDGWLGADSFNTINTSVGSLVTYGPSGVWLGRGRGSSTAPADVLVGDGLGMVKFAGHCQSGARFESTVHIGAEVKEIGTYIGANLVFGTKPMANSNPLYRMRLDADGGLVLRSSSTTDPTSGSMGAGTINATGLYVDGVEVPLKSTTTVADVTGGATVDTECRAQLNALLAALRASGVIGT
jgi:hypothetical protein